MTRKFKIGDRVKCNGNEYWFDGADSKTRLGTIVKLYPGFHSTTLREHPYPIDWRASVELDQIPENWPYNSNSFAPKLSDLESVS